MTSGNAPTVSPSDAPTMGQHMSGDDVVKRLRVYCDAIIGNNELNVGLLMCRDVMLEAIDALAAPRAAMPPAGDAPSCPCGTPGCSGWPCPAPSNGLRVTGDAPDLEEPAVKTFAAIMRWYDDAASVPRSAWDDAMGQVKPWQLRGLLAYITALNAVIADQAALAEKRRDEIEALKAGNTSAAKSSMSASTGEESTGVYRLRKGQAEKIIAAGQLPIELRRLQESAVQCRLNAKASTGRMDKDAWQDVGSLLDRAAELIAALTTHSSAVEECARVAEEMRGAGNLAIAAAIREIAPSSSTDREKGK